jgi:hypothetical protein
MSQTAAPCLLRKTRTRRGCATRPQTFIVIGSAAMTTIAALDTGKALVLSVLRRAVGGSAATRPRPPSTAAVGNAPTTVLSNRSHREVPPHGGSAPVS